MRKDILLWQCGPTKGRARRNWLGVTREKPARFQVFAVARWQSVSFLSLFPSPQRTGYYHSRLLDLPRFVYWHLIPFIPCRQPSGTLGTSFSTFFCSFWQSIDLCSPDLLGLCPTTPLTMPRLCSVVSSPAVSPMPVSLPSMLPSATCR